MARNSMTGCAVRPIKQRLLMKPYAGPIEAWEVGAEVGNVRNNRPELMERIGLH
jgi:putative SOS response-associated peptidase YedK